MLLMVVFISGCRSSFLDWGKPPVIATDTVETAALTPAIVTVAPTATITPRLTVMPTSTPTPLPPRFNTENLLSFLVFGSDWRPNSGYRTDILILVVLNKQSGEVSLVSIPRDLYIQIPGDGRQRINVVKPHGGFDLTVQTFEENFGVRPDFYVMTDFGGFLEIVDSLGGIEVEVPWRFSDRCDLEWGVDGVCVVEPGTVHMNGDTALWYVRSRYSTSDFDRTRRAQEVGLAIFRKVASGGITKIPQMGMSLAKSVETNIPLPLLAELSPLAIDLYKNPQKIHRFAIGPDEVEPYTTEYGGKVLMPIPEKVNAVFDQAYAVLHP